MTIWDRTKEQTDKQMSIPPAPYPIRHTLMISELFLTVQGEGAFIGKPTVFVRTGGCDYRCSWCDTLYAVLPEHKAEWQPMSSAQVFAQVQQLSGSVPLLVTLSGGNPAIQPLSELIDLGHKHGYTFTIETQGSVAQPWFSKLDALTLSPKPPSSGQQTRWERLDRCIALASLDLDPQYSQHVEHMSSHNVHNVHNTQYMQNKAPHDPSRTPARSPSRITLKIVVFDEDDYRYARMVAARYPDLPLYLQAGNHTPGQGESIDTHGILRRLEWLVERTLADRWYEVSVLPQLHTLLWGNSRGV